MVRPAGIIDFNLLLVPVVENIVNGRWGIINIARLKSYHEVSLNDAEELTNYLAHKTKHLHMVEEFKEIRSSRKSFEVLTGWVDFSGEDARQSLTHLNQDVPALLRIY